MQTMVRSFSPEQAQPLADDLLTLLLESAAGIHAAEDEQSLAKVVLEEACRGSGLPNAALLKPLDSAGHVEVVATRSLRPESQGRALFSRSLLATAANGVVAELSDVSDQPTSESIVQMQISAAICVPLMLGTTVAAYLYLDSRSNSPMRIPPDAPAQRRGLLPGPLAHGQPRPVQPQTHRHRAPAGADGMPSSSAAAATAQKWILPPSGPADRGPAGNTSANPAPASIVGGDFFDVDPPAMKAGWAWRWAMFRARASWRPRC